MTPAELRKAIGALGVSQVGLARSFGLDPRTVRNWLEGRRRIPAWLPIALKDRRTITGLLKPKGGKR